MSYEKLNRKAISCMFVAGMVQWLIVAFFAGGLIFFLHPNKTNIIFIGGFMALNLLYVIVSPKVRYERYRYLLNDEEIDVIEGFIFTTRNIVPIERLHKIAVMKGPIDRIFGLAKIVVTTAGGDVTIRFMEDKQADIMAMSLKNRINELVIEEKRIIEGEKVNGEE